MRSLPLSMRQWECPLFGIHHDSEENAAKNL
ncbi:MAG: hypothetical protein ABSA46_09645 [Thermodesulfovibrionales bacterium]